MYRLLLTNRALVLLVLPVTGKLESVVVCVCVSVRKGARNVRMRPAKMKWVEDVGWNKRQSVLL